MANSFYRRRGVFRRPAVILHRINRWIGSKASTVISRTLDPAIITLSAPSVTVTKQLSITLDTTVVTLNAPAVAVTKTLNITLSPVVVTLSAPAVSTTFGAINVALTPTVVTLVAPSVTVANVINVPLTPVVIGVTVPSVAVTKTNNVALTPSVVTVTVPAVTVIRTLNVALTPVVVNLTVPNVTVTTAGSQSITLQPVVINLVVPSVTVTRQQVVVVVHGGYKFPALAKRFYEQVVYPFRREQQPARQITIIDAEARLDVSVNTIALPAEVIRYAEAYLEVPVMLSAEAVVISVGAVAMLHETVTTKEADSTVIVLSSIRTDELEARNKEVLELLGVL